MRDDNDGPIDDVLDLLSGEENDADGVDVPLEEFLDAVLDDESAADATEEDVALPEE